MRTGCSGLTYLSFFFSLLLHEFGQGICICMLELLIVSSIFFKLWIYICYDALFYA